MHVKRIHEMLECITEKALNEMENGVESINTEEFSMVTDMIKDLTEAEYRAVIVKEMKKANEEEEEYNKYLLRELKEEYGEDVGRRYYDAYRYASGRFAPKGRGTRRGYTEPLYYHMYPYDDMEHMRDMDRDDKGRMYYSEPSSTHMSESNYDRARRNYTETKEMHKGSTQEDKEHKMKSLDGYMKELSTDIVQLLGDMTAEEKNLIRTKLSTLVSKI